MREIGISKGYVALVDDDDYDSLVGYKWHAAICAKGRIVYATRKIYFPKWSKPNCLSIPMHRDIMHPPKGVVVDHRDGNGLNNTRRNLRICRYSENVSARHHHTFGLSGMRGVYPVGEKFVAKIGGRPRTYLGTFETAAAARHAYLLAAHELYGEFADGELTIGGLQNDLSPM